jgi:alpha-tubulin suppressor-like RCC1 family protein
LIIGKQAPNSSSGEDRTVNRVVTLDMTNRPNVINDFALLHLSTPVPSNISPLPLAFSTTFDQPGTNVQIFGWGQSSNSNITTGKLLKETRPGAWQVASSCVAGPSDLCLNDRDGGASEPSGGDSGSPIVVSIDGGLVDIGAFSGFTIVGGKRKDTPFGSSAIAHLAWIRSTAGLPIVGANTILRDPTTGLAWLVESDGFRHWIPNGATQTCLQGKGASVENMTLTSLESIPENYSVNAACTPASTAVQISTGGAHACVVTVSQNVDCWGDNRSGDLGNGSTTDSYVPTEVPGLIGVTQISAGVVSTCAVASGNVECWGDNSLGELGNGSTIDSLVPEIVPNLSNATQVAVSDFHACALSGGGTVECWGENNYGQLGNNSTTNSPVPVAVSGLTGVVQVSVGAYDSCALLNNGTVDCWGDNNEGELGNGNSTSSLTPQVVPNLSGVVQIASGGEGDCAVLQVGTVECWGQSGVASTPEPIQALSGVTQTAISDDGSGFACADLANRSVVCWGANNLGQLGDGTTVTSGTPETVSNLNSATNVSTGDEFACALLTGGSVDCWGDNVVGELGNDSTTQSSIPVVVKGL